MGPKLFGSGGGGVSIKRNIGDLVYKHVSAPADELIGLTRANGRVATVAGNEELAAAIGAQFGLPVMNLSRVLTSGSCSAIIFYSGFWYAHVVGSGIVRSANGIAGSWSVVQASPSNASPVSSCDFAIFNGKLFFFFIGTSNIAFLYETSDGVNWITSGKATAAQMGITTTITGGGAVRMRTVNNKLVLFGGTATAAFISFSTDEGVSFTISNSNVNSRVNAMADSNGTVVSLHNNGGIQTCVNIVANGGWTPRASNVTEALNVITTTPGGVTRIVGASGRTLTSADQINFVAGQSIDGLTSPVRIATLSGMDIVLATSSALDSNRRINVSNDFTNWRSEKVAGQPMQTSFNGIAVGGNRIAIAGSSGIDMTAALAFDPATEFWIPNFDPGGDMRAYFVAE